jgi:hypothetical protein
MQCSDVVVAFNRPAKYNLKYYGPEKFVITNKFQLAMHIIKNRLGTTDIIWYYADYPNMTLHEIKEPEKAI